MSENMLSAAMRAAKALQSEADQFCRDVEDASQTGVSIKRAPGWAMGGYMAVWPDRPALGFLLLHSGSAKSVAESLDRIKGAGL